MKKARLEGNILPKAKQRFIVQGYPSADILYLTRDVIEMTLGVIELPDQTKVPGGRKRAGEFTLTLQFARNADREIYLDWFNKCVDTESSGIDPTYKRDATIIYERLFNGSPGNYNSGSALPPVRAALYGCWPSSVKLPDYDMNSDESDGDSKLEVTIQYDWADIERQNN
jgi:hypothetical protein